MFSTDPVALPAITAAADKLHRLEALVGLASAWPSDESVIRHWQTFTENKQASRLVWCSYMWLVSSQGDTKTFVNSVATFTDRSNFSRWDFAEETMQAIYARVDRDPSVCDALKQLAIENDNPNIRISIPQILRRNATSSETVRKFARGLLLDEKGRLGLNRFALDVTANRIRRVIDVLEEVTSL